MSIKQIPTQFEINDVPRYVNLEGLEYEIATMHRLRDQEQSSLLVVYKEKR